MFFRLIERLANRGLPEREQHTRAEELLARLLPETARTNNPWFQQPFQLPRTHQPAMQPQLHSSSITDQSIHVLGSDKFYQQLHSRSLEEYSSDQASIDSLQNSHLVRSTRQNSYNRPGFQQQNHNINLHHKTQYSQNQHPSANLHLSSYRRYPENNNHERSHKQPHNHNQRVPTESPVRKELHSQTTTTIPLKFARESVRDNILHRSREEISHNSASSIAKNNEGNVHRIESSPPEEEGRLITESISAEQNFDESDVIPASQDDENNKVETVANDNENHPQQSNTTLEDRKQREERRKNNQKERNRKRNRNKNRKRDRNKKKKKKNKGRNKRNKIDELIANESLILHEVDGQPFLDCCPSKLVVVEKQVGKARDKHAVELHPDSQFFYERVCLEEFEGEECIFPARAHKNWVETRCAQTYSFSQVSQNYH